MINTARHLLTGARAERSASLYLQKQGLTETDRNCRSPYGEIDLIMRDQQTVVFVEVRYRKSGCFGLAQETIGRGKQQRIIRTAQWYLQQNRKLSDQPCRFDIVAITGTGKEKHIDWISNAFY
ncbi:MAG: YraN family protein [Proteobacteria bacterium]|nr:YraN family protein [Pseudomonadota bacterium]